MTLIVHVTARTRWEATEDTYVHPSLENEGFIHCSAPDQVVAVANTNAAHFDELEPLVLLCIDESLVQPPVRYEGEGSETYPHIYGELNRDAVIDVVPFETGEDGSYVLPEVVEQLHSKTK